MHNHHNSHPNGAPLLATRKPFVPSPIFTKRTGIHAGANGHTDDSSGKPGLHPEVLVPHLGNYLIERGLLKANELAHALQVQSQLREEDRHLLLGQLLVNLGYVERATLDQVVTTHIIELHDALAGQIQSLEQQVAEGAKQLKQALDHTDRIQQHKDEFVGAISHELRTPLTVIVGYLDLLRRGEVGSVSAVQRDVLGNMQVASDRLLQIINNLLFFATLHRNEFMVNYQQCLVKDLFSSALKKNIGLARERKIRLFVSLAANVSIVQADAERIEWVLSELIENALKFGSPDDKVILTGRRGKNATCEISVRDNGPGIAKEQLKVIFEPFRQVDGSITRKVGGLGLGLTLSQDIIEAHRSQLWIKSQPGKGTCVGFSLDLVD
jgi:signal transduction histidine kinase